MSSSTESYSQIWEEVRQQVLISAAAHFSLKDLAQSIGYKPIFSYREKRDFLASELAVLSYAELLKHPDFGPGEEKRIRLIRLFRETAAFDHSLNSLSSKTSRQDHETRIILKQLHARQIPDDFPPSVLRLSDVLHIIMEVEEIETLQDFFKMTSRITNKLGKRHELGDVRRAFLSGSVERISTFLPINRHGSGVSLVTCMHARLEALDPIQLAAVALFWGYSADSIPKEAHKISKPKVKILITQLKDIYKKHAAYFTDEDATLKAASSDPAVFARAIHQVTDSILGFVFYWLVSHHHLPEADAAEIQAASATEQKKRSI